MAETKRKPVVSEDSVRKSWLKYNLEIDKIIEKARYKGDDVSWQFQDRITDYITYKKAYIAQKNENIALASRERKPKKWKAKENITRQLVKKSRIFNNQILKRYAKQEGVTVKVAKDVLRNMSRRELWDIYFSSQGGVFDEARKLYRTIVYGEYPEDESEGKKKASSVI